jgi:hypothetical protein
VDRSVRFALPLFGLSLALIIESCGGSSTPPPPPVATQATHFSVAAPATATAGRAFNVTVSALDSSDGVVASYSGKVHLTSTDAQAILPADATLTNGTGSFSVTLKTAGMGKQLSAIDTVNASISGTAGGITVNAGAATQFTVSAPNAATAGMAFNFSVVALDTYNNFANYSGMVHFTSTDAQAKLPPDAVLTNNGLATQFPATLNTIGNATLITAKDTAASTTGSSGPINVFSNVATHFSVAIPGSATTRASFKVAVTALDGAGNNSAGYAGTIHFTSTDSKAILPANSTLPIGLGTFMATLETAGNQVITATDTVTASVTGPSNSISVVAAAALTATTAAPPSGTVGTNYGPSTTEYLKCYSNRGGVMNCAPCTSYLACRPLPPCGSVYYGQCREARQIFEGFTIVATGGVPPYSWSSSSLPPGLSVNSNNGEILGAPTLAGSYQIVATVADSGTPSVTTKGNYTIVINNPQPPVINTTPAPPGGTVNQPYRFTFTARGGLPPYQNWIETGALPAGLSPLMSGGVLAGTPTVTGSFPITVTVQDSIPQTSAPQDFTIQIFAHGFRATGSMAAPRVSHTATMLNTGKVLVAGGTDGIGNPIATAELYDPTTGSFFATGNMGTARAHFAATLLTSGKVLVTGGLDRSGNPIATAELYDPTAGTFSPTTGSMQFVHASHTATLLNTGKVLVAGWGNATAELFDPATGTFAATGSMATARVGHTATLLNGGKVLVSGGIQGAPPATTVLAEAELYDPLSGSFTPTLGTLATARQLHTASLLSDGKVLVAGGLDSTGNATAIAEVFDPTTQLFTVTKGNMGTVRAFHTATVLKDKTVLLTGGDAGSGPLATAELYDPTAETFSPTGSMGTGRSDHTASLLPDGTVLVAGGAGGGEATAELYQ